MSRAAELHAAVLESFGRSFALWAQQVREFDANGDATQTIGRLASHEIDNFVREKLCVFDPQGDGKGSAIVETIHGALMLTVKK